MKSLLVIGSVFAAFSVLLGAFGAHGLKNRLSVEDLVIFETAVRYQMYHAIGILSIGVASFFLDEMPPSEPFPSPLRVNAPTFIGEGSASAA